MKMMLLVLLSALVGLSVGATEPTQATHQFDFFNYLVASEWDVLESSIVQLKAINQPNDVVGHYSFSKDNTTEALALIGRYYENDTSIELSQPTNIASVHVMFDTPSSGSWLIGQAGDSRVKVFDFSFDSSMGQSINQPTSASAWLADDVPSYYLMQIAQPDKFSIIITPSNFNEKHSITMYSLKKRVGVSEKSFFQNYGTWLMLGVFFIVQMYMKTKGKMGDLTASAAAPAPTRAAQAAKKTK